MKPVSILLLAAAFAIAGCGEARESGGYEPGTETVPAPGAGEAGAPAFAPGQGAEPDHVVLGGDASYEHALRCAGLYGRVVVLFPDRAAWAAPRIETWSNAVLETGAGRDHDDLRIIADLEDATAAAERDLPAGAGWTDATAVLAECEAFEG